MTSTPIKSDKENVLNISPLRWSPPLPSGSSKRKQLRQEQIEVLSHDYHSDIIMWYDTVGVLFVVVMQLPHVLSNIFC